MSTPTAAQQAQLDHRDNAGRFATMHRAEAPDVQLVDIDGLWGDTTQDDPSTPAEPTGHQNIVPATTEFATTDPAALDRSKMELIGQTWAPASRTPLVDPDAVLDDDKIAYVTIRGSGYEFKQLDGITDEEEHRYTADRCGYLAVSLHERTGWPLVVFADGYDHDDPPPHPGWVHAGVLGPDGRFVDVNGPSDWGAQWDKWVDYVEESDDVDEATVEEIDPALFDQHDFDPTEDDRDVADRVLRALGLGHLARD